MTGRLLIASVLVAVSVAIAGCSTAPPGPVTPNTGAATQAPQPTPTVPATTPPPPDATSLPGIRLVRAWSGFTQPLYVDAPADGTERVFVIEKGGRIWTISPSGAKALFMDISDKVSSGSEQGLLGLAFAPDYAKSREFYVDYTDTNGDTHVARFRASADPNHADAGSEQLVIKIGQPYANHNGGQIAFGPDGDLYVGMGDGGSEGDPQGNGQNAGVLLAKMLRLDVTGRADGGYAAPKDNPFVGRNGYRPEIWALGVRNPWRFSFDRRTGDLYIGDVGQNDWEEIDFAPKGKGGQNYGWSLWEATHPYPPGGVASSKRAITMPVAEYSHAVGNAVVGGYVYRGTRFPRMYGVYFYGDNGSGRIWGLLRTGGRWTTGELAHTGLGVSSFGQDAAGELYVCDISRGGVYRIEQR